MPSTAQLAHALLLAFSLSAPLAVTSEVHSELCETEHFQVRYRPASRAGASVDRTAHMVELEYDEILGDLGIAGKVDDEGPFKVFLYDDLQELAEITGVKGTAGYAAGREIHIPWDNDQTRKHELVHIVVAAMESTGEEERNMFFAEGLANAVLEYVHGIPVHAVAAYERERGTLPVLQELVSHPDFYGYLKTNPGLNAYDIGGSFFLYLLQTQEPLAVMNYYHGTSIEKALGLSIAEAEKGWHEQLDAFLVRPELKLLLAQRRGDGGEFKRYAPLRGVLPDGVLGEPDSWTSVLAEIAPGDKTGAWEIGKDSVAGSNESGGDWSSVVLPGEPHGDCVIRLRAKTGPQCWGIKVQYGPECEGMVLGQGAFIYTSEGGAAHTKAYRLKPNSDVDLVLHVQGDHVDMYVDGALLLQADLPLEPSSIGFGLVGGDAVFEEFAVRDL